MWEILCSKASLCCYRKITLPYKKCFFLAEQRAIAVICSCISQLTAELIGRALCVFDRQVAPEFSFDGRSHFQFQLLWSLPARQTRVQTGLRTRAASGVILSLLSQEQNEYLRLEVSHGWSLPSTLTALIVLFVSLKMMIRARTVIAASACHAESD